MNKLFGFLVVAGLFFAMITQRGEQVMVGALQGASQGITLLLTLAAGYALWMGFLAIAQEAGAMAGLARILRPALRFLFPDLTSDSPAAQAISTNLAANMLGVGNAATPSGLKAMQELKAGTSGRASDAMCMLLILNASSVQLIPSTVISLRAAAGALNPGDILVPALLATACSTLVGVLCAKTGARIWP